MKKMNGFLFLLGFFTSSIAIATPLPQAIDACIDKSTGDLCSYSTPANDSIDGSCQIIDEKGKLSCVAINSPSH